VNAAQLMLPHLDIAAADVAAASPLILKTAVDGIGGSRKRIIFGLTGHGDQKVSKPVV
jgi:hypothetical protein